MASGEEQLNPRPRRRYYTEDTILPFEEDHIHEFKGHQCLTMSDIPPVGKLAGSQTRTPISRTLNAFLNTGDGGTVYCGVFDSGKVKGINLSQYEKDHIKVGLDYLMMSYTPSVESHRYTLKFIPVIGQKSTPEEIDQILSFDSSKTVDPQVRLRQHVVQTHNYCWCHKDSLAQLNMGIMKSHYVIEMTIRPWDPNDPRNQKPSGAGLMKAHPIHTSEEGKAFFRRQACTVQYTAQEIYLLSKNMANLHYQPRIKELQEQIKQAKEKAKQSQSA